MFPLRRRYSLVWGLGSSTSDNPYMKMWIRRDLITCLWIIYGENDTEKDSAKHTLDDEYELHEKVDGRQGQETDIVDDYKAFGVWIRIAMPLANWSEVQGRATSMNVQMVWSTE